MKINNTNDYSKRTVSQVASILIANGIAFKPENFGDGRHFYINDCSLRTRIQVKKAGFILEVSEQNSNGLIFKTY